MSGNASTPKSDGWNRDNGDDPNNGNKKDAAQNAIDDNFSSLVEENSISRQSKEVESDNKRLQARIQQLQTELEAFQTEAKKRDFCLELLIENREKNKQLEAEKQKTERVATEKDLQLLEKDQQLRKEKETIQQKDLQLLEKNFSHLVLDKQLEDEKQKTKRVAVEKDRQLVEKDQQLRKEKEKIQQKDKQLEAEKQKTKRVAAEKDRQLVEKDRQLRKEKEKNKQKDKQLNAEQEKNRMIAGQRKDIDYYINRYDQLHSEYDKIWDENKELRELHSEYDKIWDENKELRNEIKRRKERDAHLRKIEVESLNQLHVLIDLEYERDELKAQVADLEKELADLEKELKYYKTSDLC